MNSYINYLVEASLGMLVFFALYKLLLTHETAFSFTRGYLLFGILTSLLFPAFTIETWSKTLPSISHVLPGYLLPEVVVHGEGMHHATAISDYTMVVWQVIEYIYFGVVALLLVRFSIQMIKLLRLSRRYNSYTLSSRYSIVELDTPLCTFSFFNCIYIGNAQDLSQNEKQQIIDHEIVHIDKRHSLDILLIELIRIVFWFNPFISSYKKILITIHEYQADAKATEHHDVTQYCNLLARVALMSADFKLANHFNNSLTLKRINMMKTIKHKMSAWKMAIIVSAIGALFFITACQDQVLTATEIAKSSTMAPDIPVEVQKKYDERKSLHPEKTYSIIEANEEGTAKIASLPVDQIASLNIIKPAHAKYETERTFIIVEYNDQLKEISERAKSNDDVYTVVEEMAVPAEGMDKYYHYLMNEIKYPKEAREKKTEGTVFVEFVVQLDGSLTDMKVIKSVSKTLDDESIRVIKIGPKWNPGKQSGKDVKTKMVIPIKFSLAGSNTTDKTPPPTGSVSEVSVVGYSNK